MDPGRLLLPLALPSSQPVALPLFAVKAAQTVLSVRSGEWNACLDNQPSLHGVTVVTASADTCLATARRAVGLGRQRARCSGGVVTCACYDGRMDVRGVSGTTAHVCYNVQSTALRWRGVKHVRVAGAMHAEQRGGRSRQQKTQPPLAPVDRADSTVSVYSQRGELHPDMSLRIRWTVVGVEFNF